MEKKSTFWEQLDEFNMKLLNLFIPIGLFAIIIGIVLRIILLPVPQKSERGLKESTIQSPISQCHCSSSIPSKTFQTE